MKFLLTDGGVTNPSIHAALVRLLGKPIADSSALCVPTGMYGHPMAGPGVKAWQFISGTSDNPMVELGWKSVGVLELTALPSIDAERWVPLVEEADVLLVAGGDVLYLAYWMRKSGLADLLPSLDETVWVGLSAGSMVMTPEVGEDFIQWRPPTGEVSTLGLVDFSICPHLAPDGMPGNSMADAERWAAGIAGPTYVTDGQTAIAVVDGVVDVVSEGTWRLFAPSVGNTDVLPVLELAAPGPDRESGVRAILAGTKTAMTGLPALHAHAHEPLPVAGDRFCVVDSDGRPAAVIELTRVTVQPINAVTDTYAHAEGRGYSDAAAWRIAHEDFFRSDYVAKFLGYVPEINDDTPVVTQRFRLVGRP